MVTFLKHTCKPMEVYHSKFGQQKISQDFKDCMLSIIVLRFVFFFTCEYHTIIFTKVIVRQIVIIRYNYTYDEYVFLFFSFFFAHAHDIAVLAAIPT